MIVFSSLVPYLPISPAIHDKERRKKAKKTLAVFSHLKEELYARNPDFLLLISLKEDFLEDSRIEIGMSQSLHSNYSRIGDFETSRSFNSLPSISALMNEEISKYLPTVLSRNDDLNFPESFAVDNLLNVGSQIPILHIRLPRINNEDLVRFGAILRDVLESLRKRSAVIFVGNLSHCVTVDGPAPFSTDGKKFDDKIKLYLKKNSLNLLTKIDLNLAKNSVETSLPQVITAYGMLQEMNLEPQFLSYEYPFGVGYICVRFI